MVKNEERFGVGAGRRQGNMSLEVLYLVVRRESSQGRTATQGRGIGDFIEAYLLRV